MAATSGSSPRTRWSPAFACTRRTATWLAFVDHFCGLREKDVWVMNADGSGQRQ